MKNKKSTEITPTHIILHYKNTISCWWKCDFIVLCDCSIVTKVKAKYTHTFSQQKMLQHYNTSNSIKYCCSIQHTLEHHFQVNESKCAVWWQNNKNEWMCAGVMKKKRVWQKVIQSFFKYCKEPLHLYKEELSALYPKNFTIVNTINFTNNVNSITEQKWQEYQDITASQIHITNTT